MKKHFFVFALLFLTSFISAFAQGEYDLQLTHGTYDCVKKKVTVCVEIKATTTPFKLDGGNIQILYATSQLTNPKFISRDNFSGGNYNKMDSLITLNTAGTAGLFAINITNAVNGTDGTVVGTTFMKVACLEFDLAAANSTNCYSLTLSKSAPATVITKIVSPTNTAATQGTFTSITNQCPVSPVVALTSNSNTNLVFTLQSGTPTVSVQLVDGTIINIVQSPTNFTVAPTTQTTYQIQTVTGSCGAGSAAVGLDKVTITPSVTPPDACANQKCPIITAVKRTL